MKKFFLIFIIIFSLIGFVGCTQKDDTKSLRKESKVVQTKKQY